MQPFTSNGNPGCIPFRHHHALLWDSHAVNPDDAVPLSQMQSMIDGGFMMPIAYNASAVSNQIKHYPNGDNIIRCLFNDASECMMLA